MYHDLQQLRTGVPSTVPPGKDLQHTVGICPKCGRGADFPENLYEDDPGYCLQCEERTEVVGPMAEGVVLAREFGDDAMDGAVSMPQRELELLYGWNDDSPLGPDDATYDGDLACLQ
jgi:hypothetical protein